MNEFSPIWVGSEGYGDSDDVKQDKHQASSATLCSVTSAAVRAVDGGFNAGGCGAFLTEISERLAS